MRDVTLDERQYMLQLQAILNCSEEDAFVLMDEFGQSAVLSHLVVAGVSVDDAVSALRLDAHGILQWTGFRQLVIMFGAG